MPIRRPIKSTVKIIHILPYDKNYKKIISDNFGTEDDFSQILSDIGNFEKRVNKNINSDNKHVAKIFLFEPDDTEKLSDFLLRSTHPVRLVIHGEGNPAVIGPSTHGIREYDLLAYQLAIKLSTIIPPERGEVTIDLLACCSAVTERIIVENNQQQEAVEINFAKDLSQSLSIQGLPHITTIGYTGYVTESDSSNKYRVTSAMLTDSRARRAVTQTSLEKAACEYRDGILEQRVDRKILISNREISGRDVDFFRRKAAYAALNRENHARLAEGVIIDLVGANPQPIVVEPRTEGTAAVELNTQIAVSITPSIINSTTVLQARAGGASLTSKNGT